MAVTDQQKIDFLLKKIGFTKTKTGSVVGTGAISGTPKQPFAEAIPSPLIIANGALWNESDSIPATPPVSDTAQVKVYLAASSGLRMTADATSSGQRAYIAYTTYGNTSSARLTNWIDTQFGAGYLIKVYKGDPNSGGVALSAAGSGANDGWFFDYSAGVLNFNDTNVPSGVTDTNIYIVGYRYIGLTGAPTSGISTFSNLDLTVERNLDVGKQGGISTFRNIIEGTAGENKIPSLYANLGALPSPVTYHGMFAHVHSTGRGYFSHAGGWYELVNKETNGVVGTGTETYNLGTLSVTGNVSIGGTLTYEDVKNVDAVGLITARSGISVTGGVIEAQAGENKIPSLYSNMGALPNPGTYHGMFAHVHSTGRGYFSHAGGWYELVNVENNGVVGTGTQRYNLGALVSTSTTATSLNVSGVTTTVTLDVNGDLDVDGHTNLDNVSIAGFTTASEGIFIPDDKKLELGNTSGSGDIRLYSNSSNGNTYLESYQGSFTIENETNNTLYINSNYLDIRAKNYGNRYIYAKFNSSVDLYYNNVIKLRTASSGINVVGTTTTGQLAVTGVSTFTGNIDANGDLDVDGHTNLDNVSIAGVTSVASLTSGRVVTAGTGGKLQDSNNLTFDGTNLFVSGINVTGGGSTSTLGADIVTRNLKATGISTFEGNVRFNSTITAGGSTGTNGQYLKTTATGVEWASFPTLRTRQTFTASSGQTAFSFSYTVNFIDVFVNGIKLTDAEFTATNGSTVVLAVGCFVGDIVELVSYNTVSGGGGGGGGGGISNVVEDTTPQLGGNLDLFNKSITGTGNVNITGIITATNFVGDGSGLTNVVGSGSGVIVKNSGSNVGTAGTIDFGNNLSVSPASAGIVTITATGISTNNGVVSVVNDLDVDGHTNLDNVSIAGVVTATTFVGALTGNATGLSGNPSIDVTDLDVDGHTNLDNVSVAGVTTFSNGLNVSSGQLTVATLIKKTSGTLDINANAISLNNAAASATYATFSNGGASVLKWNNTDRLETTTSGVTVTGTVAATSYTGDGSQLTGIGAGSTADVRTNTLQVVGVSTFNNTLDLIALTGSTPTIRATNASDKLQLRSNGLLVNNQNGFRGLEFTGSSIQLYSGQMASHKLVLETDAKGIKVGTGVTIETNGQATYTGIVTASSFVGDGSSLTGISAGVTVQDEGSALSTTATTLNFVGSGVVASGNGATKTITIAGGSSQDTFRTIAVAGQSDVVADNATDTLTLVAGSNMTITTNAGSDTITFASSGGGGGTDVGITTALTGTFTASAGSPSTINTFAYHDNDKVVEYTVYIKNGSDFQTAKVLAMRDSTTIHSTQFAVMFSSSLLAQFDTTISGGNILLRATPETGVSGSTSYRIKREVM